MGLYHARGPRARTDASRHRPTRAGWTGLGDPARIRRSREESIITESTPTVEQGDPERSAQSDPDAPAAPQPFAVSDALADNQYFHGTRADLSPGDLIEPGYSSNFGSRRQAKYVYLTATLDAATWGAELALGDGPGRIYTVEPTGPIEDDPNLTDKKFPGNPTKSYRTREPLRVVGEVLDWQGHDPAVLQTMKDHLEQLKAQGIEAIE